MIAKLIALLAVFVTLAACSEKITCAGVALVRTTPADTTIGIGASFVVRYQEGGTCSDESAAHYSTVPVVWHTADTTIIQLDTISGKVTGRTVGDGHLTIFDGNLVATVHVR